MTEGSQTTRYGVGLDSRFGLTVDELMEWGGRAAELGFDRVWTTSGAVIDPFHLCGLWSRDHAGIRTGIGVVPASRSWHPASLAAQGVSLATLSGGGFVLGIGIGTGGRLMRDAPLVSNPTVRMRRYAGAVRDLLAGESIEWDSPVGATERYRLSGEHPKVPLYLAAMGPKMLAVAAEYGDGVMLNWASPEQLAWSLSVIDVALGEIERPRDAIRVAMYVRVAVDDDVDAARRALAGELLRYALAAPGASRSAGYRGHFARMGIDDLLSSLEARFADGAQIEDLVEEVPDELLRSVGYFGAGAGAADHVRELAAGLDDAIVRPVPTAPGLISALGAIEATAPLVANARRPPAAVGSPE